MHACCDLETLNALTAFRTALTAFSITLTAPPSLTAVFGQNHASSFHSSHLASSSALPAVTKTQAGLRQGVFTFASFNQPFKISPGKHAAGVSPGKPPGILLETSRTLAPSALILVSLLCSCWGYGQ